MIKALKYKASKCTMHIDQGWLFNSALATLSKLLLKDSLSTETFAFVYLNTFAPKEVSKLKTVTPIIFIDQN